LGLYHCDGFLYRRHDRYHVPGFGAVARHLLFTSSLGSDCRELAARALYEDRKHVAHVQFGL
jgi:hypothetical protein